MTDKNEGLGGSYIRQPNGSLKLTERTEHPDRVFVVEEEKSEPVAPDADAPKKGAK